MTWPAQNGKDSEEQDQQARFEETIMPHLDAAYNLARWLTRNEHDAQDVVQDAFLRAFKLFSGFRGGGSRARGRSSVRKNTYSRPAKKPTHGTGMGFRQEKHDIEEHCSE